MEQTDSQHERIKLTSRTPRELLGDLQGALRTIYPEGEAQAIARRLVEARFHTPFYRFLLDGETPLEGAKLQGIGEDLARLLAHEPVQYVVGETGFCDLTLRVTPAVLIPRPETELLTLVLCRLYAQRAPHVLDVGTGSGAIAIALAKGLPYARVEAIDVSAEALAVARENAARHGVEVDFTEMDVLSPIVRWPEGAWNLVVSNPPYIPASREEQLAPNVSRYEPRGALYVPDDDPLLFYRAILQRAKSSLREGGMMAFEIDSDYNVQLFELAKREGYGAVEVLNDFAEKPRFLLAAVAEENGFVAEFKRILESY